MKMKIEAARHISEEARILLTSLRNGPPFIANGPLAQNLMNLRTAIPRHMSISNTSSTSSNTANHSVESYALPFLNVILDPRAAGPQTLVALRCVYRMLSRQSLLLSHSNKNNNNNNNGINSDITFHNGTYIDITCILRNILDCRFEQTDQGNDEAVEMAIADVLSLIVSLLYNNDNNNNSNKYDYLPLHSLTQKSCIDPELLMEAFNTVFVTRNTFVHSPALCYHFEQVLHRFIQDLFGHVHESITSATVCRLIFEFLVSQLLHTPMDVLLFGNKSGLINSTHAGNGSTATITSMSGTSTSTSAAAAALNGGGTDVAFYMHDATRILCLGLIQSSLRCLFQNRHEHAPEEDQEENKSNDDEESQTIVSLHQTPFGQIEKEQDRMGILDLIQDDLCLSLLMIGQGIWAYQDSSSGAVPGMISTQVLSEICNTVALLWNLQVLRPMLVTQFESIFTGFYQRALGLLRRLPVPSDSETFHANQIFDMEVEIILESLVDIFCLNDQSSSMTNSNTCTFESLFLMYDCNFSRSDVASGLIVELSRCCGGALDEEGHTFQLDPVAGMSRDTSSVDRSGFSTPQGSFSRLSFDYSSFDRDGTELRHVPAHLREICAAILIGAMNSLFIGKMEAIAPPNHCSDILSVRKVKEKKRLMREATCRFNDKASDGIRFLIDHGILSESPSPKDVALFLRNGITFDLDKQAIGEYLGSIGKSSTSSKAPPEWEQDWFHKDTLKEYCSSFHFKNQRLLDCLRMFLSSFRLPGEAQQIDRILQAFAETCASQCEESQYGSLKLFSPDPKKASDAAYLLSFSIIMLQTDLHNKNIKADRKMKVEDFVKYNTDYGSEITEPGYTFPADYLIGIYESIRDIKIRTEAEGADGVMTFDRWKDVLKAGAVVSDSSIVADSTIKVLILEQIWLPVLSSIRGFWNLGSEHGFNQTQNKSEIIASQGSRLGIDVAIPLLKALRSLSMYDIFEDLLVRLCFCTGLIGEYRLNPIERSTIFLDSIERQSAATVVLHTAVNFGDTLRKKGWTCVWLMLLELRDLKLISEKTSQKNRSLVLESDTDFLTDVARKNWNTTISKAFLEATGEDKHNKEKLRSRKGGFLGSLIFGSPSSNSLNNKSTPDENRETILAVSNHEKEKLGIWNEDVSSDIEDELEDFEDENTFSSLGNAFETLIMKESEVLIQSDPMPGVTGLETYDDYKECLSPRAVVRRRIVQLCDLRAIITETRFFELEAVENILNALVDIISGRPLVLGTSVCDVKVSPASEALAEIWLCEIALKNRDRTSKLWESVLKKHYNRRLCSDSISDESMVISRIPGMEKCCTSIMRLAIHNLHRRDVSSSLLKTVECMCKANSSLQHATMKNLNFNKHISEGMWRICRDVDGLRTLDNEGWDGLLKLIDYCASKRESISSSNGLQSISLYDDDPSLQTFRSIHLILRTNELRDSIPFSIVWCIRTLISTSSKNNCPKLGIASLDLLSLLHARLDQILPSNGENQEQDIRFWTKCWVSIVEGMSEGSNSRFAAMRQHAISMCTEALLDEHVNEIPLKDLCTALNSICVVMAENRISELFDPNSKFNFDHEEIMIELKMCISATFKPFMQYIKRLSSSPKDLSMIWMSILKVSAELLSKESYEQDETYFPVPPSLLHTTKQLATEHLRNAVMMLIAKGILSGGAVDTVNDEEDISILTWSTLNNISYIQEMIPEWMNM